MFLQNNGSIIKVPRELKKIFKISINYLNPKVEIDFKVEHD